MPTVAVPGRESYERSCSATVDSLSRFIVNTEVINANRISGGRNHD